jgi:hypothetical protein
MSSNPEVDDSAAMIVVSDEEQSALEISTTVTEEDDGVSIYDAINSRRSPKTESTGNKRA